MYKVLLCSFLLLFIDLLTGHKAQAQSSPQSTGAKVQQLCPQITVHDGEIDLNDNEKILICGQSDGPEGWRSNPLPQAEILLRAVLASAGYQSPSFERGFDYLKVWKNKKSLIERIETVGDQGLFDVSKKRKILGYPMVTVKLDEMEAWADLITKSQGYACGTNNVQAFVDSELLTITTDLDKKRRFPKYEVTGLEYFNRDILDRYQPFENAADGGAIIDSANGTDANTGDFYDIRKTQIMTTRMLSDGLFQTAFFTVRCKPNVNPKTPLTASEKSSEKNFSLRLETSVGKPHILRFGIGGSTEELPFLDASYRNTHIDNRASSYTISTHLSPRIKSLTADSELYLVKDWTRTFFSPKFKVSQETENSYEANFARLGYDIGRNWDMWNTRMQARGGPVLNYSKTLRGEGPQDIKYSSFEGMIQIMSHNYEFHLRDQYEGWLFQFFYRGQNKGLGSAVDLHRFRTSLKTLWNLGGYYPPLFVLGARFEQTVVDVYNQTQDVSVADIPIEDRIFLGGDQNLRGFGRGTIDNSGLGYLTAFYMGFELRLIEELPYRLQPFLLWDYAKLGASENHFDSSIFISEGLGLRWLSPFGSIRGSAARGRVWNKNADTESYPEKWVYFLSFGREF